MDDSTHVEQVIWHGDPSGDADGELTVGVARRDGDVVTIRLRDGDRLVADVRLRNGPKRRPAPHDLLRTGLGPGATCTRTFVVTEDATTDHVPGAVPVL